jgi:hypothetical protein
MAMQPLILAVQNSLEMRDMGAGTSAATFFRSLGGSVGVAALGAVLTNQLASLNGVSINDPASLKKLPPAVLNTIEHTFVRALHPIFLVAALVSLIAVVLCLLLPDRELHGAGPGAPTVDTGELAEATVG